MPSVVEIIFKTIKQGSGEKDAKQAVDGVNMSMKDMAKNVLGNISPWAALGAAVVATTKYLLDASKAAAESNQISAKQNAILEATGYAANIASVELAGMASEMSKLSGIDDELITSSQSMMLTFRNIGREEFPRAMQAAIDLSTTFGGLEQSSMQLGKALNDPIKGVTALAKSGVTFSEEQKKQIENFTKTNQLAKAQAIILAEVENQVGGTAKAINDAGDGSARLNVSLGNLSESIGQSVLPAQRSWNDALTTTAENLTEVIDQTTVTKDAMQQLMEQQNVPEWLQGLSNNALYYAIWRDEIEQVSGAMEKNAAMTDHATKLYLGMGGSLADLKGKVSDVNTVLNDQETNYKEILGLGEDIMTASDEQTPKILYNNLLQKLSVDGITEAEYNMATAAAQSLGIMDTKSLETAKNMDALTTMVQNGELAAWKLGSALAMLPSGKSIDVVLNILSNMSGAEPYRVSRSGPGGGGDVAVPRDSGGAGSAGMPYLIGTGAQPEMFVPNTSGTFIPNADKMMGNSPVDLSQSSLDALARVFATAYAQMGR